MTKILIVAASLCLGVSGSFACEFQRSAKANQTSVDPTVVASVALPQTEPATVDTAMGTPPLADAKAE